MRAGVLVVAAIVLCPSAALGQKLPIAKPQAAPCCNITAVDQRTGAVTARVKSTGQVFEFIESNASVRSTLKAGGVVYANFTNRQVSLDGRTVCCQVTTLPHAATRPSGSAPGALPGSRPTQSTAGNPGRGVMGAAGRAVAASIALPSAAFGSPSPPPSASQVAVAMGARFASRRVTAMVGGKNVSSTLLHLRGLDGIEKAPGIPDGVRRLLEMHVRTLARGESDHYIINTELAEQWASTHPVPDDIKPADVNPNTHSGCHTWSMHCASEAAQHAEQQTQQQWDALRDAATKAWNHASDELTHDWNVAAGCFADDRISLPPLPVEFNVTPQMTIPLETSGKNTKAGASGTLKGTLGIGFPMQGNFTTSLDLFYIPCLPFLVRPRSFAGSGTLGVGEKLTGSVTATGQFDKTFTIPPTGGPKIPIEVVPVIIAGVPVAEVDVSAYIEGNVEVGGAGRGEGRFEVDNPHQASFEFNCSGSSCGASSRGIPDPSTASESAEINGRVFVRPDIYTALQLDFDYDALSVRAGPQPYLLGAVNGCVYGAAAQSTVGSSTAEEDHALTGDLDWGVDLRAEALVASKVVGAPYRHSVTGDKHLWFADLAPGGSTALIAALDATATSAVGHPASIKVQMPTCYPFTNPIHYQVSWNGSAAPAVNPACHWQARSGTCTFDPRHPLAIDLTWPTAGTYNVTVVATGDEHHRTFSPRPPPTTATVRVTGS